MSAEARNTSDVSNVQRSTFDLRENEDAPLFQRHSLSTLSEINITPLLDLAFVLLIIFMITTPLLENSVNLVIPSSGAANAPVDPPQVQTISIDRNGSDSAQQRTDRYRTRSLRDWRN